VQRITLRTNKDCFKLLRCNADLATNTAQIS